MRYICGFILRLLHSTRAVKLLAILACTFAALVAHAESYISPPSVEPLSENSVTDDCFAMYPSALFDDVTIANSRAILQDSAPTSDPVDAYYARTRAIADSVFRNRASIAIGCAKHVMDYSDWAAGKSSTGHKLIAMGVFREDSNTRRHLIEAQQVLSELPQRIKETRKNEVLRGAPLPDVMMSSPSFSSQLLNAIKFVVPIGSAINGAVDSQIKFYNSLKAFDSTDPSSPEINKRIAEIDAAKNEMNRSLQGVTGEGYLFIPRVLAALAGQTLPGESWLRSNLSKPILTRPEVEGYLPKVSRIEGQIAFDQNLRAYVFMDHSWWTCKTDGWKDIDGQRSVSSETRARLDSEAGECDAQTRTMTGLNDAMQKAIDSGDSHKISAAVSAAESFTNSQNGPVQADIVTTTRFAITFLKAKQIHNDMATHEDQLAISSELRVIGDTLSDPDHHLGESTQSHWSKLCKITHEMHSEGRALDSASEAALHKFCQTELELSDGRQVNGSLTTELRLNVELFEAAKVKTGNLDDNPDVQRALSRELFFGRTVETDLQSLGSRGVTLPADLQERAKNAVKDCQNLEAMISWARASASASANQSHAPKSIVTPPSVAPPQSSGPQAPALPGLPVLQSSAPDNETPKDTGAPSVTPPTFTLTQDCAGPSEQKPFWSFPVEVPRTSGGSGDSVDQHEPSAPTKAAGTPAAPPSTVKEQPMPVQP